MMAAYEALNVEKGIWENNKKLFLKYNLKYNFNLQLASVHQSLHSCWLEPPLT
jgi:hypothetical protein